VTAATALTAADRRELLAFVARLRVGHVVDHAGADAFVPIFAEAAEPAPHAELLDEALAAGTTALRELDEGGDVNRVLVTHHGVEPLLLLDGEQIVGAKQNRVLNATFLVAPGSVDVPVHVSCVERGRWRYEGAADRDGAPLSSRRGAGDVAFRSAETTLTGVARSKKLRRTTHSMITGGGYDSDQRAVWADVDDYLERSRVMSRTSSFEEGVASRRAATSSAVGKLAPQPGQVGMALVRRGRLVLMDLFGSAELYARGYRKVALGMLADGAEGEVDREGAPLVVAHALGSVTHLDALRCAAPGLGETLAGEGGGLSFAALVHGGALYHVVIGAA
jgi:hypothetical protein